VALHPRQVVLALFDNDQLHDRPKDARYLSRSAALIRQSVEPHLEHSVNHVDRYRAM
jgi:hypothetical protein